MKKRKLNYKRIFLLFLIIIFIIFGISKLINNSNKNKNNQEKKEIKKTNIKVDKTEQTLNTRKYYIKNNLERYKKYLSNLDSTNNDIYDYTIMMVNANRDYEYYTNVVDTDLSKKYLIIVNKYNKLDSTYVPDNLVTIDSKYGITGKIESTVYEAYKEMWNDAKKEGMNLYIRSPYRSYQTQNNLYERYASTDGYAKADTYSARPGYSEHQTGLAFDVTTPTTTLGNFEETKEFEWLKDNAYKYGFILRYPKGKEDITGYMYESWHYRYVGKDVAKTIHDEDITFEEYYAYYIKK